VGKFTFVKGENYRKYSRRISEVLREENLRRAFDRALVNIRDAVRDTLKKFPKMVEKAQRVREIKERAIRNMGPLTKEFMESVERVGGVPHLAKTAEECKRIFDEIIGSPQKNIVISKSMTNFEIGLRAHLEEIGHEVVETDLGDFFVQQLSIPPAHVLLPAVNIPRETIAELLSRITGRRVKATIEAETAVARDLIRQKFIEAHVGISSANVAAADSGTIIITENEGNARLVTGLPRKHLALVGMEKIVPTLDDAFLTAQVQWAYSGVANPMPSYVNLISGPSQTADIECTLVKGMHGPGEFHVVLLDNGRAAAAKDSILREVLYCIRCGRCLLECPVYYRLGPSFGYLYTGGIGIGWSVLTEGDPRDFAPLIYACAQCRNCVEVCPLDIDCAEMMIELRKRIVEGGHEEGS
jgi:L-lactate dehydrogenase complex protein LldG